MDQVFVDKFMNGREQLKAIFKKEHPEDYQDIVKKVIDIINPDGFAHELPDPERIHQIDDGDYQGTLVFVIASRGYGLHSYWYVMISYGSCSGCDTLINIHRFQRDDPPNDQQVEDYMTLALHVVQNIKRMDNETV